MKKFLIFTMTFMFVMSLFCGSVYADTTIPVIRQNPTPVNQTSVFVSGMGEVEVQPDIAYINLSVTTENKYSKMAQVDTTKAMNEVFTKLNALGIVKADIKTTSYSINIIRDYNSPQPLVKGTTTRLPYPIVGYSVTNSIKITIKDINNVSKVVDELGSVNYVSINGLNFGLAKETVARMEAIKNATENARLQANTVAELLGKKVVNIKSITVNQEHSSYPQPYYNYSMMKSAEDSMSSTPISTGEIKFNATVNMEVILE